MDVIFLIYVQPFHFSVSFYWSLLSFMLSFLYFTKCMYECVATHTDRVEAG